MKPGLAWTLRVIPAIVIGQTLPFKFFGAAESKALFTKLTSEALGHPNLEAFARIGTGLVELVAIVLILIPKHSFKGALLTVMTMAGALISHLLFIGFSGNHGQLAAMALVALISSALYLAFSLKSKT